MMTELLARCWPSVPCPQQGKCAHCNPRHTDPDKRSFDGTAAQVKGHCWLFVDERGMKLYREAA